MLIKILTKSIHWFSLFLLVLLSWFMCFWLAAYEYEYNFAKFDGTVVRNLKDATNGEPKLYMGFSGNATDNIVTKQGILVRINFCFLKIFRSILDWKFEIFVIDFEWVRSCFWIILKIYVVIFLIVNCLLRSWFIFLHLIWYFNSFSPLIITFIPIAVRNKNVCILRNLIL